MLFFYFRGFSNLKSFENNILATLILAQTVTKKPTQQLSLILFC